MKTRQSGMPQRETWEGFFNPSQILAQLGMTREIRDVVDFGCGYGTFSVAAARIVRGTVYAVDIDPTMTAATAAAARAAGVCNVEVIEGDFVAGIALPEGSADYAMLFNILHAEERDVLLREAHRLLRPRGILAIVHWNHDPTTPRGPSMAIRPKPQQCLAWAQTAGLVCSDPTVIDLPPYHWGLMLQPQDQRASARMSEGRPS